ncbi:MAG: M23 family metallopeptidase [Erysipelotrichaceae bacterium]|nr:M23 family metallopeptidase [Erysipelotrichaceae bacterium]
MKKNGIIGILLCFVLSCLVVFGLNTLAEERNISLDHENANAKISQKVLEYSENKNTYHKLYESGQLIGVISDMDFINDGIAKEYENYKEKFPETELGLSDNMYIVDEDTYNVFENKDEEIVDYLISNNLLGVKTHAIEFSTAEGVFDIIYVNNIDDFYTARDQFLLNFVSQDTIDSLRNNKKIDEPSNFGTVEMGLTIKENMTFQEAYMPPNDIYTSVNEIYNYLCYGRNEERQYYKIQEGDTLQGVGYRFQNMSPKQIMLINPDVIFSENQVLEVGMSINVTYFSSPLTVVVTKNRLAQQVVNPQNPEYRQDSSLSAGVTRVDVEEINGLENVMYEETWVNGVLQEGKQISSVIVRAPVRGVITVGTHRLPDYGTGNYIWPVDNPAITCHWGCYFGHTGTDLVNIYQRYGPIYAADTGVVSRATYNGIDGYFVVIDHQNGYKTHYGHMTEFYVTEGQAVQRGDVIGMIGFSGVATGPHVHFHFIVDGVITNACTIMDCTTIS